MRVDFGLFFGFLFVCLSLMACTNGQIPNTKTLENESALYAIESIYPSCLSHEEESSGLTIVQCRAVSRGVAEDEVALVEDASQISEGSLTWDSLLSVSGASVVPVQCRVGEGNLSVTCYTGFSSLDETILRVVLRISKDTDYISHISDLSVAPKNSDLSYWDQYGGDRRNVGSGNLWKFSPTFSGMQLLPN